MQIYSASRRDILQRSPILIDSNYKGSNSLVMTITRNMEQRFIYSKTEDVSPYTVIKFIKINYTSVINFGDISIYSISKPPNTS